MIKLIIKRTISHQRLEKILRAKQYVKDSGFLTHTYNILPPINHRLGNEVVAVSPVSALTIPAWRHLVTEYEKAGQAERDEFRAHVRKLILADSNAFKLMNTAYLKSIFGNNTGMYYEFLGTAWYAAGEVEKAFEAFAKVDDPGSRERILLYQNRCLIHFAEPQRVVAFLTAAIKEVCSDLLILSLAVEYFKLGEVAQANEVLSDLSDDIRKKFAAAHNLSQLKAEISKAITERLLVRPAESLGFQQYGEDHIRPYWETLFYHFNALTPFQHGWADLRWTTESRIEEFLKKYCDIGSVLNFGVYCAVPDHSLSGKFPDVKFIGVDREEATKRLNETAFQSPNISFHAMDMLDLVYEERNEVKEFVAENVGNHGEMMVFHARTATLIYPEAIKRFYKACARLGVKYIGCYENAGLSKTDLKYYDFEDMSSDAVPYFSVMIIHNYKKYLEEAGYEIIEKKICNYSDLLWEGKDLWGMETSLGIGDAHYSILARLRS